MIRMPSLPAAASRVAAGSLPVTAAESGSRRPDVRRCFHSGRQIGTEASSENWKWRANCETWRASGATVLSEWVLSFPVFTKYLLHSCSFFVVLPYTFPGTWIRWFSGYSINSSSYLFVSSATTNDPASTRGGRRSATRNDVCIYHQEQSTHGAVIAIYSLSFFTQFSKKEHGNDHDLKQW